MQEFSEILVACGGENLRSFLMERFREASFNAVSVPDAAAAEQAVANGRIWLAIVSQDFSGADGVALCKRMREKAFPRYLYTLLLLHEYHKDTLAGAVEEGVDDFVVDPTRFEEILARIVSARRVLHLDQELKAKNRELIKTQQALTLDLEMAARIQQGLLPCGEEDLYGFHFDSLFLPCCMVGGDMFNFFPVDNDHVAFYILDVSGHGIPAAMMSVAASKTLTSLPLHESVAFSSMGRPFYNKAFSPAFVARELDVLFRSNELVDLYLTMIYGVLDKKSGEARFVQAGHPYPVFVPAVGEARLAGTAGPPVGLVSDAEYTESTILFAPGDTLFLYTDGIPECTNGEGETFTTENLMNLLSENRDLSLPDLIRKVGESVYKFHGHDVFPDDISLMAIRRNAREA